MLFNFSDLKLINCQTLDYIAQIECLLNADYPF